MGYLLAHHVVMFTGLLSQGSTPLTHVYGVYLPNQLNDGWLSTLGLYVLPLYERMFHYDELTL